MIPSGELQAIAERSREALAPFSGNEDRRLSAHDVPRLLKEVKRLSDAVQRIGLEWACYEPPGSPAALDAAIRSAKKTQQETSKK